MGILRYSNSRKALAGHVEKEDRTDGVTIRDAIGRDPFPVLINESGLYSLILCSKLSAIRRRVICKVLPNWRLESSLREYGKHRTEGQASPLCPVL